MKNFGQKTVLLVGLLVAGTAINYIIHLHGRIESLKGLVTLSEMRSDINTEWANDVTWDAVHQNTQDMLKEQGRLEGIVQLMDGTAYDDAYTMWHEGYQRGLNQSSDFADMEYDRGYHAAMKQVFQEHPTVNNPPKEINREAIKTPKFDESTGSTLPETNEEVDKLNIKIENLFEPEDK